MPLRVQLPPAPDIRRRSACLLLLPPRPARVPAAVARTARSLSSAPSDMMMKRYPQDSQEWQVDKKKRIERKRG